MTNMLTSSLLYREKFAAWWAIRNARNYANKCDAVITPTPSVGKIIKKWGVTNENITAIPTGVEEKQFANPDRESVRKKYGVKNDELLLFVMTRLTAEKNMEFLVECGSRYFAKKYKNKIYDLRRWKFEKQIDKKNCRCRDSPAK